MTIPMTILVSGIEESCNNMFSRMNDDDSEDDDDLRSINLLSNENDDVNDRAAATVVDITYNNRHTANTEMTIGLEQTKNETNREEIELLLSLRQETETPRKDIPKSSSSKASFCSPATETINHLSQSQQGSHLMLHHYNHKNTNSNLSSLQRDQNNDYHKSNNNESIETFSSRKLHQQPKGKNDNSTTTSASFVFRNEQYTMKYCTIQECGSLGLHIGSAKPPSTLISAVISFIRQHGNEKKQKKNDTMNAFFYKKEPLVVVSNNNNGHNSSEKHSKLSQVMEKCLLVTGYIDTTNDTTMGRRHSIQPNDWLFLGQDDAWHLDYETTVQNIKTGVRPLQLVIVRPTMSSPASASKAPPHVIGGRSQHQQPSNVTKKKHVVMDDQDTTSRHTGSLTTNSRCANERGDGKSNASLSNIPPFCIRCQQEQQQSGSMIQHHSWCPKNRYYHTSGAKKIMERILNGISKRMNCAGCWFEYRNGRKCCTATKTNTNKNSKKTSSPAVSHSKECRKNYESKQPPQNTKPLQQQSKRGADGRFAKKAESNGPMTHGTKQPNTKKRKVVACNNDIVGGSQATKKQVSQSKVSDGGGRSSSNHRACDNESSDGSRQSMDDDDDSSDNDDGGSAYRDIRSKKCPIQRLVLATTTNTAIVRKRNGKSNRSQQQKTTSLQQKTKSVTIKEAAISSSQRGAPTIGTTNETNRGKRHNATKTKNSCNKGANDCRVSNSIRVDCNNDIISDDDDDDDNVRLTIQWDDCNNPWGINGYQDDDIVLYRSVPVFGQMVERIVDINDLDCGDEVLSNQKRFTMYPFASSFATDENDDDVTPMMASSSRSRYSQTHASPQEGFQSIVLHRNAIATIPWGFTIQRHEFGGACLVSNVELLSPAATAAYVGGGPCMHGPLRVNDMIIEINGKRVGGMTLFSVTLEFEICGPELTLLVSRYKFPTDVNNKIYQLESNNLKVFDKYVNDYRRLKWADVGEESFPQIHVADEQSSESDSVTSADDKYYVPTSRVQDDVSMVNARPHLNRVNNVRWSQHCEPVNANVENDDDDSATKESDVTGIDINTRDIVEDGSCMDHSDGSTTLGDAAATELGQTCIDSRITGLRSVTVSDDKPSRIDQVFMKIHKSIGALQSTIPPSDKLNSDSADLCSQPTNDMKTSISHNQNSESEGSATICDLPCRTIAKVTPPSVLQEIHSFVAPITIRDASSDREGNESVESSSVEEDDNEDDDGNAIFPCVCGVRHGKESLAFWIQCESCESWYDVSSCCVGFTVQEAPYIEEWICPGCPPTVAKVSSTQGCLKMANRSEMIKKIPDEITESNSSKKLSSSEHQELRNEWQSDLKRSNINLSTIEHQELRSESQPALELSPMNDEDNESHRLLDKDNNNGSLSQPRGRPRTGCYWDRTEGVWCKNQKRDGMSDSLRGANLRSGSSVCFATDGVSGSKARQRSVSNAEDNWSQSSLSQYNRHSRMIVDAMKDDEVFAEGVLIQIEQHSWPGVNNEGGLAKVIRAYLDDDGDQVYDIRYTIYRKTVRGVLAKFVTRSRDFCHKLPH